MTAQWGRQAAELVAQSLQELDALEHLGDLAALPHVRLVADSSGKQAMQGAGGIRLVLEAPDGASYRDGHLEEVRSIVVVDVAVIGVQKGPASDG